MSGRRAGAWLTLAACALGSVAPARAQDVPLVLDGIEYMTRAGARSRVRFAPRDSLVAARVLELLDAQARLPGLPDSVPTGVTAVLAHTPRAFDEATGGGVPEWRAGVAIPALNELVIPTGEGRGIESVDVRRTLRHEWAHLGLAGYLGPLRVPRWFDEGYAQWASGGWDATQGWRLRVMLALGRAPPLDSLTLDWPRERAAAETAYLLAASAVGYLIDESGERGLELLLARWRDGGSFDGAMRATYGVTEGQLEGDWRRYVRRRYGWLLVLSHSAIFWMALALVLLFMLRRRQTRDRERMARLRAGEIPEAPAFWMEQGPQPPDDGVGRAP